MGISGRLDHWRGRGSDVHTRQRRQPFGPVAVRPARLLGILAAIVVLGVVMRTPGESPVPPSRQAFRAYGWSVLAMVAAIPFGSSLLNGRSTRLSSPSCGSSPSSGPTSCRSHPVDSVTAVPFFRKDGSVITERGYYEDLRHYNVADLGLSTDRPQVSSQPSPGRCNRHQALDDLTCQVRHSRAVVNARPSLYRRMEWPRVFASL